MWFLNSTDNSLINQATVTLYRASDNQPATVADGDLHVDDVNPVVTSADGFYSFIAADGDYYFTVESEGYDYPSEETSFDAGRTIAIGSKGETFTVAGVILEIDHPVDASLNSMRIVKKANKNEITVGGVVTYTVTIENLLSVQLDQVYLQDKIPPGFKIYRR